ncbi:hypothetical protein QQS21_005953 [Conoideocrella luteorostrata]|uniref:Uncharacterized protein n=1 Tax=Conoideocrella luteorostrata TaxID=1105319 RepID=A0AAJ0FYG0_9HYPO|nr:hypothetical protein QQS21_005953 [Conoideocrella luteorostrata]
MRTKTLSMVSQHIIYNLRNHFENIVDLGNLDDRRTPIVRENIDMLALAGRECFIFSYSDVAPFNSDRLSPVGEHLFQWPNWSTTFAIAVMAIIIGCLLTILTEMWNMWDPVGRGINMYSWTLGMAREIDNLLNEFYEYDKSALIRKHAYMNPSSHPDDMSAQTADSRPQTV